jgi:hypothetical protein
MKHQKELGRNPEIKFFSEFSVLIDKSARKSLQAEVETNIF